ATMSKRLFQYFFFFQAEDGIRDGHVTGVQTCALPISAIHCDVNDVRVAQRLTFAPGTIVAMDRGYLDYALYHRWTMAEVWFVTRSEERRVGKECRCRCAP